LILVRSLVGSPWQRLEPNPLERDFGLTEQVAGQFILRLPCRRLEADSKPEIKGLDAGLKASSTQNLTALEFFSSL
jgi:hypothetical protein